MATKVNADHLQKLSKTHSNVATSVKAKTSKAHATASRLKLDTSRDPKVKHVPTRTQAVAQRVNTRTATINTRSTELAKRADYVREQATKASRVKAPTKSVVMGKTSASADAMHRTANKLGATTRARPKAPTVKTPTSRSMATKPVSKPPAHQKPAPGPSLLENTIEDAKDAADFAKDLIESSTETTTKPVPRKARRSPSRAPKPAAKKLALTRVQSSPSPKRAPAPKAPNATRAKPAPPLTRRSTGRPAVTKPAPVALKRAPARRALPGSAPRVRAKAPTPTKVLSYKPKLAKTYKPILGPARNLAKPARMLSGASRVLNVLDLGMTAHGQYTASRSQGRTKKQAVADAGLKTGLKATGAFVGGRAGGVLGGAMCSPVPVLVPLCYAAGSFAGSYVGGKVGEAAYARMRPAPIRKPPIYAPPRRR
jgi:hypothetical protein